MAEADFVPPPHRRESRWVLLLFVAALIFHLWASTVGWSNRGLPGHEFRQTQTAISAFFIQREHNFSLEYPVPVLGKPWTIPMEFPLYQWTVVLLSNKTGLPLVEAARLVSLWCFYLTLPAFYLLLGRLGLVCARRLVALGLVLVCPIYIFYSRAFLIETMALFFGAWFLAAYLAGMERKSLGWLAVAAFAGLGAGLVKVTTFLFFLMPAFGWTIMWLIRDLRGTFPARDLFRRIFWCAGAVAIPFTASIWWVHFSDRIKNSSVTVNFLNSETMNPYHFGYGVHFSPEIWEKHWQIISQDLTSISLLVAGGILAIFFARRWWGTIAVLMALFFAIQLIFPILYAWHDYYYMACAFTLMLAFGFVLCGLFESRLPRWAVWGLVLAAYAGEGRVYFSQYYDLQKNSKDGGSNVTLALEQITAPDDVLVIAGNDWNAMTPYYSQRRALMIRRNKEFDWDMIESSFKNLKGESVTALLLHGDQVQNQNLINLAARYFQIDPRPAFRWRDITVFLHEQIKGRSMPVVKSIPDLEVLDANGTDPMLNREILTKDLLARYHSDFAQISPEPVKYFSRYGTGRLDLDGHHFMSVHPDTRFWFNADAGRHTAEIEVGLMPAAYSPDLADGDRTDGVEIRIEEDLADGGRRLLTSRLIDPAHNKSDQGVHSVTLAFELEHAGAIVLSIGPGPSGNYARDWAIMGRLDVK